MRILRATLMTFAISYGVEFATGVLNKVTKIIEKEKNNKYNEGYDDGWRNCEQWNEAIIENLKERIEMLEKELWEKEA